MRTIAVGWLGLSAVVMLGSACATESAAAKPAVEQKEQPAAAAATATAAPETKPVAAADATASASTASAAVETRPAADTKPATETKPAETKAEPAKTEAKPADKNAEAKPDAKAADKKADAKPAEAKPAEKKGGAYTLVPVAAPDKKVERQWKSKCSSCHGMDGKADTEKGHQMKMEDFSLASWQTSHGNDELKKTIHDGLKRTQNGVKQDMDPFGDELSAAQIDQLVQYVRFLGAPK